VGAAEALDEEAFCLPRGLTRTRLKDVVLQHLREHPDAGDRRGSRLIVDALQAAFPCRP